VKPRRFHADEHAVKKTRKENGVEMKGVPNERMKINKL
jgi:hypothetical protein